MSPKRRLRGPRSARIPALRNRPDAALGELVRAEGLEPPRLSSPEPKSGASTNSATPASERPVRKTPPASGALYTSLPALRHRKKRWIAAAVPATRALRQRSAGNHENLAIFRSWRNVASRSNSIDPRDVLNSALKTPRRSEARASSARDPMTIHPAFPLK